MALTYDQETRLKDLAPVLDEHAEWFGRIMRKIAYPDQEQGAERMVIPVSFKKWIASAQNDAIMAGDKIEALSNLYADLQNSASQIVTASTVQSRPDIKDFDHFVMVYEEFVSHLRRLERDLMLSDSGFDVTTGLRTPQVMMHDLRRELERRARQGRPFCLALARIDHHDSIRQALEPEDYNALMRDAAGIIKECIRSFDDAYHLGEGEFMMCLKQTELSGGTAGLNRLNKLLEQKAPYFNIRGQEYRLGMSSCVAEPLPEDDIDTLLINMRADLNKYGSDPATIVEYVDISPVQRFLSGAEDDVKKP
jgi:GGDEF domain-containing protein